MLPVGALSNSLNAAAASKMNVQQKAAASKPLPHFISCFAPTQHFYGQAIYCCAAQTNQDRFLIKAHASPARFREEL